MPYHLEMSVLADHVLKVKSLDVTALEHVESCAECRLDLRWLEQIAAIREYGPPESAVDGAMKTFKKESDAA